MPRSRPTIFLYFLLDCITFTVKADMKFNREPVHFRLAENRKGESFSSRNSGRLPTLCGKVGVGVVYNLYQCTSLSY